MRLSDQLDVPLRERNELLLAGGYAPAYPQHGIDEPELESVRTALAQVLRGHEPYPAVVVDRWWNLVDANSAVATLTEGCAAHLLEQPNVLRLSLHPDGLARRIVNLGQWRAHLLEQLHRRSVRTGDPGLAELERELGSYPGADDDGPGPTGVVLPLRLRVDGGELALFSIEARVGTATDVTVDELSIETFYPADSATADYLRRQSEP